MPPSSSAEAKVFLDGLDRGDAGLKSLTTACNAARFTELKAEERCLGRSPAEASAESPPSPLPNNARICGWHQRLDGDEQARQYLYDRGLNYEALAEHMIALPPWRRAPASGTSS